LRDERASLHPREFLIRLLELGVPSGYFFVGFLDFVIGFLCSLIDFLLSLRGCLLLFLASFGRFVRRMIGFLLRPTHFLGVYRAALHGLRSLRFFQNWRWAAGYWRRFHHDRRRAAD
jgi:hypothetical protein